MHDLLGHTIQIRSISFMLVHLKEHLFTVPARFTEDVIPRHQTTVTRVEGSLLRRVRENVAYRNASNHEMDPEHL